MKKIMRENMTLMVKEEPIDPKEQLYKVSRKSKKKNALYLRHSLSLKQTQRVSPIPYQSL